MHLLQQTEQNSLKTQKSDRRICLFNSAVKGTGWTITRIILGLAAFAVFIHQMFFAGNWIIQDKQHEGRKISSADYVNLTNGEMVYGPIENVVSYCGGTYSEYSSLSYYLVRASEDKFIVFRTESGSQCELDIIDAVGKERGNAYFIGYVNEISDNDYSIISTQIITDDTFGKLGINGRIDEHILRQAIDVSVYKEYSDTNVFIASIVGGLLMLTLSFLFLKKPVKDIVYSINVARGKIQPEIPEIDYVQHKEEFKKYEEINPDLAEDIEYYENYEKDSIDFNKEKEHKAIYGDDYQPPTLEKDIPTYDDYKYDSLDFAQDDVKKKDISEF